MAPAKTKREAMAVAPSGKGWITAHGERANDSRWQIPAGRYRQATGRYRLTRLGGSYILIAHPKEGI